MDTLKTICSNVYGTETTEEFRPLIRKYHEKVTELTSSFVKECVEQNIEYNSAYGLLLSMVMGELSLSYCHKCLDDMEKK